VKLAVAVAAEALKILLESFFLILINIFIFKKIVNILYNTIVLRK
jgi:hypothetical protein